MRSLGAVRSFESHAPLLRAKVLMAQLGMAEWDDNAREAG